MFINRDKNTGAVIDQRSKDGHSVEISGRGRFNGHRFLLKTHLFGDKRCVYCGKWFHWKDTDAMEWQRTKNIDDMNRDRNQVIEPLHCGSEHCQDYHHRYLIAVEKRRIAAQQKKEELFFSLFTRLKKQGVIS